MSVSVSVSVPLPRTDPAAPACQRGWCCRLRSLLPCCPINAVVVVVLAKTDRDSGAGTALSSQSMQRPRTLLAYVFGGR